MHIRYLQACSYMGQTAGCFSQTGAVDDEVRNTARSWSKCAEDNHADSVAGGNPSFHILSDRKASSIFDFDYAGRVSIQRFLVRRFGSFLKLSLRGNLYSPLFRPTMKCPTRGLLVLGSKLT